MLTIPASAALACAEAAKEKIIVTIPVSSTEDTEAITAFVTLNTPAELAVPAIVIKDPATGIFPDCSSKVTVALLKESTELLRTFPRDGPVRSLKDPKRYRGVPLIITAGVGLNGDLIYTGMV